MLLNATTAISTSSILLVPYSKRHVLKYHEWMKDEEIQQATASEPLTLAEEYAMQQSWRQDRDKLTFIACLPLSISSTEAQAQARAGVVSDADDAPEWMIGDTNLFLRYDDDDDDDDDGDDDDQNEDKSKANEVVGEIELMIAEKQNQGRGFGRAALLTFLWYVVSHEREILDEFLQSTTTTATTSANIPMAGGESNKGFKCLSVKIGKDNARSLALFESLGFEKISPDPNYFGEFELRRYRLGVDDVGKLAETYGVKDYRELGYYSA